MEENRKQRRIRKAIERKLRKPAGDILFVLPPKDPTTYKGHKRGKSHHWGDKGQG